MLSEQSISPGVHTTLLGVLTQGRALDRGNPTPENIQRDFRSIRQQFWSEVERHAPANAARRKELDVLNAWRNAIAHHDFTRSIAPTETLALTRVRKWRRACNGLATSFDAVVGAALTQLVGKPPW